MNTQKMILGVVGGLIILSGGIYLITHRNTPTPGNIPQVPVTPTTLPGSETTGNSSASETINPNPGTTEETSAPTTSGDVVSLTVEGGNFKFTPNTLTVKKGQTVKLTFTNADGFHDWKIDEFNAHTSKMKAGASETIEFVADKVGSFEYYCSVGSHRAMGMKGTLTVTE